MSEADGEAEKIRKERMEWMVEEIIAQVGYLEQRNEWLEAQNAALRKVRGAAEELLANEPTLRRRHLPLAVALDDARRVTGSLREESERL